MSTHGGQKARYQYDACCYCELARVCLPSGFFNPELKDITRLIDHYYLLQAGEKICFSGEKFRYLYAIKSGSAKEITVSIKGNEQVADFYLPGEIVGLDAISTGKYSYDAIALESTTVCIIPFSLLLMLAVKMPQLQRRLVDLISQKLLDRTRALMSHHYSAEQRLAAFLSNMGDRYKYIGLSAKNYYLSMSRYDIGSYLNLTPETVSRLFSKFQDEGILIVHKKHIQLVNPSQLVSRSYHPH
ncbi:MAG: transcriptional regulator [Gammaproteobacteria bacterium]|nr:transcriptional regulator [Gammaproteobacteria bacterium]